MTVDPTDVPQGARIAGRFVVEARVRRGDPISVYVVRAETSTTARYIARVVRVPNGVSDATVALNRELQRVSSLRQRAIPTLTTVARDEVGMVVITERPDGKTLREVLSRSGRLKGSETARLVSELAVALDAMHGASPPVLHRALTPDNITFADRMLRVWIEEAGLAQALAATGLLGANVAPAAMAYLSPSELTQRPSAAGDFFSLASVVFECLTGTLAFDPSTGGVDAMVGGAFPSVQSARSVGAADIDAVLKRAWTSGTYPNVAAFARDLSRALLANPSSRGMPAARPRANTPETSDGRKATIMGVAPESASRGEPMKSTLLGVGMQSRGAAPRVPGPVARTQSSTPSFTETADIETPDARTIRQRRLSETTQRVEVPRIRPPGTEPADTQRTKVAAPGEPRAAQRPVGRLSSTLGHMPGARASQPPTAAPPTRAQAAELFRSVATVVGPAPPAMTQREEVRDVETSSEVPTVVSSVSSSPSLRALKTTLMTGAGLHDSRPPSDQPAATESIPDAESPLSERAWGEIEAALDEVLPSSVSSVPPLPVAASNDAAFGLVSADTFDIVSSDDFAPVVPAPRTDTPSVVETQPEPAVSAPLEMPRPVTPLEIPAAASSRTAAAVQDASVEIAPEPVSSIEVSTRMPEDPEPAVASAQSPTPMWAPLSEAPEEPPRHRGRYLALGVCAILAVVASAAAGRYVTGASNTTTAVDAGTVRVVARPRVLTAVTLDAASAVVVVDATAPTIVDDGGATLDASGRTAPEDVSTLRVDRVMSVDVAPQPSTRDRSRDENRDSGGRRRPSLQEFEALQARLQPAVRACITDGTHRRHVHVGVRYDSTGRVTSVRVASPYSEPPIGPCIENAVRAQSVAPFEADHHSKHFTFDSH